MASAQKIAKATRKVLSKPDDRTRPGRVPSGIVVTMRFSGYDPDGGAVFVFDVPPTDWQTYLPPHDHRDNSQGGFAFAVFHPGTNVPQMPYAM